jgi:hypothetical protein
LRCKIDTPSQEFPGKLWNSCSALLLLSDGQFALMKMRLARMDSIENPKRHAYRIPKCCFLVGSSPTIILSKARGASCRLAWTVDRGGQLMMKTVLPAKGLHLCCQRNDFLVFSLTMIASNLAFALRVMASHTRSVNSIDGMAPQTRQNGTRPCI